MHEIGNVKKNLSPNNAVDSLIKLLTIVDSGSNL